MCKFNLEILNFPPAHFFSVQLSPEEPVEHNDDPEQRKALELEMSQYHIREEILEEGSKNDTRLSAIREETEEVTSFR